MTLRLQRLSDQNPTRWPLKAAAEMVRQNRRPAAADNPFVEAEHAVAEPRRSRAAGSRAASPRRSRASCSRSPGPSTSSALAGGRIREEHPTLGKLGRQEVKATVKEAASMLRLDRQRALAALPRMLPSENERREAVDIVRRIGYADGEITPESEPVLTHIERILELDRPAPAKQRARRGQSTEAAAA